MSGPTLGYHAGQVGELVLTNSDQSRQGPGKKRVSLLAVLTAYLAIMRPYIITVVGLGLAVGCWNAGNWPGTYFFLSVAAFPYVLRLILHGVGFLRRGNET